MSYLRYLGASTGWLGGIAQRWVALVGLAATVLGIVSFALSEDLSWAWLAIAAARDWHARPSGLDRRAGQVFGEAASASSRCPIGEPANLLQDRIATVLAIEQVR